MSTGIGRAWVTEADTPAGTIQHRNGVKWLDAPAPPAVHEHTPQSRRINLGSDGQTFYRCACGAGRYADGDWMLLDAPRVESARTDR